MRELPILFKGEMVKAILAGRKTQTRRIIESEAQKIYWNPVVVNGHGGWTDEHGYLVKAKYQVGDVLWAKEQHYLNGRWRKCGETKTGKQKYAFMWNMSSAPLFTPPHEDAICTRKDEIGWFKRSPLFMEKWMARIWLEVVNVRVERVQDISEQDAIVEGILSFTKDSQLYKYWPCDPCEGTLKNSWQDLPRTAKDAFTCLWDSINAKRGFGWDVNPWVFVYEFKRIKK